MIWQPHLILIKEGAKYIMKKILCIVLVLIMMFTMMPLLNLSALIIWDIDVSWEYEIINGEAIIKKCIIDSSGKVGNITVPLNLEGYPVTIIGEKAFQSCKTLERTNQSP